MNAKKDGTTPLHQAVFSGYKEMAEMLIAKGADVNAKDKHGETPLNWAIDYNQADLADLLRKHGGKTGEELKAAGKWNTSYSQQSQRAESSLPNQAKLKK